MIPIDATSMRAAEVILHHGETLAVIYVKPTGEILDCRLHSRGPGRTARVTVWHCDKLKARDIPWERILLPEATEARLQAITRTQRRQDEIDARAAARQIAQAVAGALRGPIGDAPEAAAPFAQ